MSEHQIRAPEQAAWHKNPGGEPAVQPAPGRMTDDEFKKLILSASTDYERYTAQVIARQRQQINALEAERDALREALRMYAPGALAVVDRAMNDAATEQLCSACGHEKEWQDCWNCHGEGYLDSSEFRDYDGPEPYWQECQICKGEGGYQVCSVCHPEVFA